MTDGDLTEKWLIANPEIREDIKSILANVKSLRGEALILVRVPGANDSRDLMLFAEVSSVSAIQSILVSTLIEVERFATSETEPNN